MRRRWVLLAVLLVLGCSRRDGGGTTATSSVITDPFLLEHNARVNGGLTTRWPNLPITVDTGGFAGAEGQFNRWRDATGGAVTFTFGGSGAGIRLRSGGEDPGVCGFTETFFTRSGNIVRADVTLTPIWNSPECDDTIAHEAGHAIGFFGHTADGTLMDIDGGNGQVTRQVAEMIRTLYSVPPGTVVRATQVARGSSAPRGELQSVRFVTPARGR